MINIWGTTFMVGPFLGPALAGYIGAGTNWRDSIGVLTAIYGLSTLMVLVFGAETYYNPGRAPTSRVGSYFGFGNTKLPKGSTLWHWCKVMVLYVFKFPLLMTGIAILVTFTWPIGMYYPPGRMECVSRRGIALTFCALLIYECTGITTTIDSFLHSPPYNFDTIEASSMRFAGVIGALGGKPPIFLSPANAISLLMKSHSRFPNNILIKSHQAGSSASSSTT
jgi:MFS family permease